MMAGQNQSSRELPVDFDEAIEVKEGFTEVRDEPGTPKDTDGIPYCKHHHCRMKRSSGGRRDSPTTYYKCAVAKCKETAQIIKTKLSRVVPVEPVTCPRCSTDKSPVACERERKFSNNATVVLECPRCKWKTNPMPTPQMAAQLILNRPGRRVEAGIGDR
jgi:DNA-directed RNA polymerase subunit M/transcription elongation factor TFIIS